jgi:hypothetical protein
MDHNNCFHPDKSFIYGPYQANIGTEARVASIFFRQADKFGH